MTRIRDLRHPPVVEAIVDLTVRYATRPEPNLFADFAADLGSHYEAPQTRHMYQFVVADPNQPAPTQAAPVVNSYVFRSADGSAAAQSRPDGFTFSSLPPYCGWSQLISKALPLWEKYRARFIPERVIRCSVRYINRLLLPVTPTFNFDDYVIGMPKIPTELPQTFSDFGFSYVVPLASVATMARVNLSFSARDVLPTGIPIMFDIDVLQECDADPTDLSTLTSIFDNLRTLKNLTFFGTLTETAIRVFE